MFPNLLVGWIPLCFCDEKGLCYVFGQNIKAIPPPRSAHHALEFPVNVWPGGHPCVASSPGQNTGWVFVGGADISWDFLWGFLRVSSQGDIKLLRSCWAAACLLKLLLLFSGFSHTETCKWRNQIAAEDSSRILHTSGIQLHTKTRHLHGGSVLHIGQIGTCSSKNFNHLQLPCLSSKKKGLTFGWPQISCFPMAMFQKMCVFFWRGSTMIFVGSTAQPCKTCSPPAVEVCVVLAWQFQ